MCSIQSGGGDFGQRLECSRALFSREGADCEPRRLLRQRLRHCGMRMPQACNRDAREEIDVGVAVGVGEGRAFAVVECEACEQGNSLTAWRDIFLFEVEDLFRLGSWTSSLNRRG